MRITKRQKAINEVVGAKKSSYTLTEAIELLKKCPKPKFDESVEVAISLGIDPKKSEQSVRGATLLPAGTGKKVKVAVFAQGENALLALDNGADKVGFEDLMASMKAGDIDYDVVIATPDAMRLVGQLGQILGPKGLMPNPKVGTVTNDIATTVRNAKAGQVRYRSDKNAGLCTIIGKISFSTEDLKKNFVALLTDIKKLKPQTSKGIFLKKVVLSTTMGPGFVIEQSEI